MFPTLASLRLRWWQICGSVFQCSTMLKNICRATGMVPVETLKFFCFVFVAAAVTKNWGALDHVLLQQCKLPSECHCWLSATMRKSESIISATTGTMHIPQLYYKIITFTLWCTLFQGCTASDSQLLFTLNSGRLMDWQQKLMTTGSPVLSSVHRLSSHQTKGEIAHDLLREAHCCD